MLASLHHAGEKCTGQPGDQSNLWDGFGITETLLGSASPHRGPANEDLIRITSQVRPPRETATKSRPRTVRRTHTAVGPEGKQGKAYGVPRMQYVLRKQRAIVLKHMLRQKSRLPLLHCQKRKASGSFPVISRFCLNSFVRSFIQPVVASDSRWNHFSHLVSSFIFFLNTVANHTVLGFVRPLTPASKVRNPHSPVILMN